MPRVPWVRFVLVVLGAGFVTSMTDWLFAGDWIHKRWTYPEVWRQGEGRAIVVSSVLPFVTCSVFAYVAIRLGLHSLSALLKFAAAIWLLGPLPLILTNAAFIKLHRVFVMFYALSWLVKLGIAAVALAWFY